MTEKTISPEKKIAGPLTFFLPSSYYLTELVKYADDAVLIARTQEMLSRLLHFLQHLAARIGPLLNGSKSQLLCIHASLPISLSLHVDAHNQCDCPFCVPFFQSTPDPSALDSPLSPLSSAKYLGSYIAPTSSSVPNVNFRFSQASSAFKTLDPFFRHPLISPKN